jgi:pectate lyase
MQNQTQLFKAVGLIFFILGIMLVPELAAAQTVDSVKVNFQPATSLVPAGYIVDLGALFGSQGSYTYGWNINHTDVVRARGVNATPLLDTLVHVHAGGVWELVLANGDYNVTVGIGDASFASIHTINVEGNVYWNALALSAGQFVNKTVQVSVSDSRLTLNNGGAGEKATRLNFIEVVKVGSTPTIAPTTTPAAILIKINYQPKGVPIPAGYLPDFGEVRGVRNGYTYGWSVASEDVVRDRNLNSDQALDTLVHFHAGAKWEINLPTGTYAVTASVGDAGFSSIHTINVEGINYWTNTLTSPDQFAKLTKSVSVTDGLLTISSGSSGEKLTRINFIEISGGVAPTTVPPTPTPTPTPTLTPTPTSTGGTPDFKLVGFATLNGGTTGGAGGPAVTANTGTALQAALNIDGPRIIYINSKITPSNSTGLSKIDVKNVSNISIIGVGTSAEFEGIGMKIRYASNIIVRNVKIHHVDIGEKDCIGIEGPANNIWIDHCELYNTLEGVNKDYYDGLLDAKADSAYMTFSWNYLHDSWKSSLVGFSDSDNFDRKITYHHNYFKNCNSRLPSYRFGTGHIFNNYYLDVPTSGINTRMGAKLRIENNHFERVLNPITSLDSPSIGYWDVTDNIFIACTGNQPTTSNGSFTPPYSYSLTPVNSVKTMITQYAGVGKINP